MGVKSRQRRAAKQRSRPQAQQRPQPRGTRPDAAPTPAFDREVIYAEVHHQLVTRVHLLARRAPTHQEALAQVVSARRQVAQASVLVFAEVLAAFLAQLRQQLHDGGWPARDRHELVARHDRRLLRLLEQVEHDGPVELGDDDTLATGLRLAALLRAAPPLAAGPAGGARVVDDGPEHPKLRQVRALLAKAESTEFEEEAEALMAKAQELISRHSLADLLAAARAAGSTLGAGLTVRRIWLDAPYVPGKATLVDQVARANRCRAVLEGRFDFCLLVGRASDLTAIELLVTSLLLQADSAMLRHRPAANAGRGGGTRAFRHAFWMAFAVRIGQRLLEADQATAAHMADTSQPDPTHTDRAPDAAGAATSSGTGAGDLLPALRAHEEHVEAAFDHWVGRTRQRSMSISSGVGWAAGTAAGDLAQLGGGTELGRDRTG